MAALAISPRKLGSLLLIPSGLITFRYPADTNATGTIANGTATRLSTDQCWSNILIGGMNAIHTARPIALWIHGFRRTFTTRDSRRISNVSRGAVAELTQSG